MARPLSEFEADDEIGGYIIIRVLSRNCFGSTYLCQHAISEKRVVIKTFPPGIENDPGFLQRYDLVREQIVNIVHPNILLTRQLAMQNGEPYVVFEYLLGARDRLPLSLQDILIQNDHLSENQVYRLMIQICNALEYAHACKGGVIHCNLKPANIFFTQDGQPKVTEFGLLNLMSPSLIKNLTNKTLTLMERQRIGKVLPSPTLAEDPEKLDPLLCSTEALSETLEYMSPEQKKGYPVTPQSNVYSMGLILYRMLTGRSFSGMNEQVMPSDIGLNPAWDIIICKAISENPAERYQTISEMRDAVRHIRQCYGFWGYATIIAAGIAILMAVITTAFHQVTETRRGTDTPDADRELHLAADDNLHHLPPPHFETIPLRQHPSAPHSWRLSSLEMVFAYIPPMTPGHRGAMRLDATDTAPFYITIDYPFWMGVMEVTQRQFLAITSFDPSLYRRADALNPVHCVTWEDAEHFCQLLTRAEQVEGHLPQGWVYRLPTESEWLLAYYAESTSAQRIRHVLQNDIAWHFHNSDERPQLTGLRSGNAYGLYDMEGNLMEWCYDFYGAFPDTPATDYTGPANGSRHVLRGGGFRTDSTLITPFLRGHLASDSAAVDVGFRIVLAPPIDPITRRVIFEKEPVLPSTDAAPQ